MSDISNYWLLSEAQRAALRTQAAPSETPEEDELDQLEGEIEDCANELDGAREHVSRLEYELLELKAKHRTLTGERTRQEKHEEQARERERLATWQALAS